MSEVSSARPTLKRRLFIAARLAAAGVMWVNMALILAAGKAEAGLPVATLEWNKAWKDLRHWALNPPPSVLTPLQKLNLEYLLPASLLCFWGIPVRLLTDNLWLIVLSGVAAWALSAWLIWICYRKEKQLGKSWGLGLLGILAINAFGFVLYYATLVVVTGALVSP